MVQLLYQEEDQELINRIIIIIIKAIIKQEIKQFIKKDLLCNSKLIQIFKVRMKIKIWEIKI
jgi:hypothetical protein